jgi:RimJ/RimL family protein N-acetyltransferase
VTLNCLRLWCMVRRNNKPARRGAERLGFKILGVAEDEFGEGKDGVIYTMSRANCKWIKNHG